MEKHVVQKVLRRAHGYCPDISLAVRFWDGTQEMFGRGAPLFRLVFSDPSIITLALRHDPVMALGEAYVDGSFDVEGDLHDVVAFWYRARNAAGERGSDPAILIDLLGTGGRRIVSSAAQAASWFTSFVQGTASGKSTTPAAEDVRHHYDLGNDFFSLWLDETMSYSCAYFLNREDSLEQAQRQKIEYTLSKLQLKPGERLLDIGSGWGWLIITAAQKYGARALGITLSREQYKATRQRIQQLGLESLVDVQLKDFRSLSPLHGTFDKIVSVGMFEHVGEAGHKEYMETVFRLLKSGGLSLLHTITRMDEGAMNPWLTRHIFPGGYVPSFRQISHLLPDYDFHLIDVESLRLHYALTLDHWAERFERHAATIEEMFDQRFVRMWRLYLRSCAASFRWSGLNIHQLLFSKGINNDLPLTRNYGVAHGIGDQLTATQISFRESGRETSGSK